MLEKLKINLLIITFLLFYACTVKKSRVINTVKSNSEAVKIKLQDRRVYAFENQGVFFSNDFPTARMNALKKVNDSTFNIAIEPENSPINQSAWYAFKVWGKSNKNVYVNLIYTDGKHRYPPKVTNDGLVWNAIKNVSVSKDKVEASFMIQLSKDTMTIAAQEIESSNQSYQWMNNLTNRYKLNKQIIGYSIAGKPIVALNSTHSNGKKLVVIMSRQHPPEVTGYLAMTHFVEKLLDSSEEAKAFNKEYELVIIPMINPDGVDEGNWRHNFAGVDLNRDWIDFKQPETKAVKDFLLKLIKTQKAKVYFAVDFHSTYNDVLYINEYRDDTNQPDLVKRWIEGLNEFEHHKSTPVKPSGNGGNVSKAWLSRALNAEALTYEVGDNTAREVLKDKAKWLAQVLMKELSK